MYSNTEVHYEAEGKVALISGGARGMGAAEAKLFASEGAKVVLGNVLDEEGQQVEAEIAEAGGEAVYVHLDVTSESEWQSAVSAAVERFGKLDILVNNAGIFNRAFIHEQTEEDWDRVMDINGKGVFLGTKAAIPAMREAGGGSIVNISSVAGREHGFDVVQRIQGGGEASDEEHGCPVREGRHSLQLCTPRSDTDADAGPSLSQ